MRKTFAIAGFALALAGCGERAPAPVESLPQAATISPLGESQRTVLANILTCRDRPFLSKPVDEQRAMLAKIPGVACTETSPGAPQRCTVTPSLKIGNGDINWFVIGMPSQHLVPIVLPAPPEALRNAMPAGSGALSPGTDLGDTTVECALTDRALSKGAISGTVKFGGDVDSAMRVCAFELAEGVPVCAVTQRGQRDYRLDVARGDYLVLAIPVDARDMRVGYTECDGAQPDAPCSHELSVVTVQPGETTTGIDPGDQRKLDDAGDWPQPPPAD